MEDYPALLAKKTRGEKLTPTEQRRFKVAEKRFSKYMLTVFIIMAIAIVGTGTYAFHTWCVMEKERIKYYGS